MATDKFDEFVEETHPKFKANVEGAFDCQHCDDYVTEAYYDADGGLMVWRCSEGHVSKIKDFHLG